MVIQCPECTTRFKLSDDKMKPEGVKVRCAKCRHIFTVMPELVAEEPPVTEEPAMEEPAAPAPVPELKVAAPEAEEPETTAEDLWGSDFGGSDLDDSADRQEQATEQAPAEDDWSLSFAESDQQPQTGEATAASETDNANDWSDLLGADTAAPSVTAGKAPEPEAEPESPGENVEKDDLGFDLEDEGTEAAEETEASVPSGEEDGGIDESILGLSDIDDLTLQAPPIAEEFQLGDEWAIESEPEEVTASTTETGSEELSDADLELPSLEDLSDQTPAEEQEFRIEEEGEEEFTTAEATSEEEEIPGNEFGGSDFDLEKEAAPAEQEFRIEDEGEEDSTTVAAPSQEDTDVWGDDLGDAALGFAPEEESEDHAPPGDDEFQLDDSWEKRESEPTLTTAEEEPAAEWEEASEPEIGAEAFDFEEETVGAGANDEFEFEEDSDESLPSAEGEEPPLDEFVFEEDEAEAGENQPDFSFEESADDEFSFESEETDQKDDFAFDEDNLFDNVEEPPAEPETTIGIGLDLPPSTGSENDQFGFEGMAFGKDKAAEAETIEVQEIIAPVEREKPVVKPTPPPEPLPDLSSILPPATKQKRKTPLSGVLRIFLVLLLVLAGLAGYLLWQGGVTGIMDTVNQFTGHAEPPVQVEQIRLPLPKSFFIMNQEAGQLFVVQGEAVNGYPENRSAIAVKGMLHDGKGNVLMQQTVFCGNMLSYEELQTESFAKIEEAMNNQFGTALSNLNVGPGKAIPYMIVFRTLPDNVTEFTVEVVDSKPGGQH